MFKWLFYSKIKDGHNKRIVSFYIGFKMQRFFFFFKLRLKLVPSNNPGHLLSREGIDLRFVLARFKEW